MFNLFALFLLAAAPLIRAQTQAQIQACANSLQMISYEPTYTWSTTDTGHNYNATYTYNPALCTNPSTPVTRIQLIDLNNNQIFSCSLKQFDSTGQLYTVCQRTLGQMATDAMAAGTGPDEDDYYISLGYGRRPTIYTFDNYFNVDGYTPPTPSGQISRRKVTKRHQCDIPGFNYCRTGSKSFSCIDVSSSLYSCGACPESEQSQDCTAIEGADRVECRTSQCFVHTCLRGYQVSTDRKSCIASTSIKQQKRTLHVRRR